MKYFLNKTIHKPLTLIFLVSILLLGVSFVFNINSAQAWGCNRDGYFESAPCYHLNEISDSMSQAYWGHARGSWMPDGDTISFIGCLSVGLDMWAPGSSCKIWVEPVDNNATLGNSFTDDNNYLTIGNDYHPAFKYFWTVAYAMDAVWYNIDTWVSERKADVYSFTVPTNVNTNQNFNVCWSTVYVENNPTLSWEGAVQNPGSVLVPKGDAGNEGPACKTLTAGPSPGVIWVSLENMRGPYCNYGASDCLNTIPKRDAFITVSSAVVYGCTDSNATNYNPLATVNDGSCTYDGGGGETCQDPNATNYGGPLPCVYPPLPPPGGCVDNASTQFTQAIPSSLTPGQQVPFTIRVTDTGNTRWYHGGVYQFLQKSGLSISPTYGHLPFGAYPGDSIDWGFTLTAPTAPGNYSLQMQMIHNAGSDYIKPDGTTCSAPTSDIYFGQVALGNFTIVLFKSHIVLSPASFTFTGVSGGIAPAGKTLNISNTGNATLNWTGLTNQTWCHLSSGSGSIAAGGSQNVTVTMDAPSNVGTFSCTITISGANADNSPQSAAVTYTVSAGSCPAGQVNLSSTSINVGQTSTASAPSGFTGGTFSSSNTSVAAVAGSTVTGIGAGSSNISGSGWSYPANGATGCALSARTLTVTVPICILTISQAGTGSGTVTTNPSGTSFSCGTVVTLTTTPSAGSTFTGWSGDADCSDGNVTLNTNKTCVATFNLIPPDFTLKNSNAIYVTVISGGSSQTSNNTTITVTPANGFSSNITLSASSDISGAIYNFSPNSLNSSKYSSGSVFNITVPSATPKGPYTIIIQGADGGLIRTVNVVLNVESFNPSWIEF